MRFLLNLLVVLLVAALIAGGVWFYRQRESDMGRLDTTAAAVRTLQRQITVQAGMGAVEVNGRGWPKTVDPSWFGAQPPMNDLVSPDRPWLEVAPASQKDLDHPPVRMTITEEVAAFWYNPGTGIVRARVPVTVSDRRATEMYNAINGTTLVSIFAEQGPIEQQAADDAFGATSDPVAEAQNGDNDSD